MTAIARGEENTSNNINWFTTVNGAPTDMFAVEFQVFDISGGLPGSQIFPAVGWEDVSSAPGNFALGSYYAYDNTNSQGWTPEVAASLGTHRIYWRWKYKSGSSYQTGAEDFQIQVIAGAPAVLYISVDDVRAEGLENPPHSDADIQAAIVLWQQALERACRQWFYSRELTIVFDGNNSDALHMGVPIIEIEYIKLNDDENELPVEKYRVYNSRTHPDNRRNPRVKLVHSTQLSDIYVSPFTIGELKFYKGRQNQEIKGTFGFLEPDGSTPALIKRALLKLVIEKLTHPIYTPAGEAPPDPSSVTYAGVVIEEKTDGHSIKYGTPAFKDRRVGLSGLTQDAEVLDIIKLYRAPIGIATTSYWSYT